MKNPLRRISPLLLLLLLAFTIVATFAAKITIIGFVVKFKPMANIIFANHCSCSDVYAKTIGFQTIFNALALIPLDYSIITTTGKALGLNGIAVAKALCFKGIAVVKVLGFKEIAIVKAFYRIVVAVVAIVAIVVVGNPLYFVGSIK